MTESPWRPHERMFSPGKEGVDPRLFDGTTIKAEFRESVINDLNRFWGPRYGHSWEDWSRVYLAGGEASHWYNDHNDLDILIGVDYGKLGRARPAFQGLSHVAISKRFNDEFRSGLNSDHYEFGGQTWERTFYVNPDSYDIRRIKPYAAYDLTADEWAVTPFEAGTDWGPEKINPAVWHFVEHSINHVRHILNDLHGFARQVASKEYYDYLHTDRSRSFGPYGDGIVDRGNVIIKALDMHPDHLLERLIAASKGEDKLQAIAEINNENDDYRMNHRPGEDGAPLHDVNDDFIHDFYGGGPRQMARLYGHGTGERWEHETAQKVHNLRGKPHEMVDMYRAAPKGVSHIRTGDWVGLHPEYARQHAEGMADTDEAKRAGGMTVYHAKVPAHTLRTPGDSLHEWGYFGPHTPGTPMSNHT